MSARTVFIISELFEPSVDAVIKELVAPGSQWVRFNTETFPLLSQFEIQISKDEAFGTLHTDGRTLDTRDIRVV